MKKTYIKPSIEAVKIKQSVMIGTSTPDVLNSPGDVPQYSPDDTPLTDESDI